VHGGEVGLDGGFRFVDELQRVVQVSGDSEGGLKALWVLLCGTDSGHLDGIVDDRENEGVDRERVGGDVGESEEGALEQELPAGRVEECVMDALDVEWVDGTPRKNAADDVDLGFDDGRCGVEVGEPVGGGPECIDESALPDVEQPVCAEARERAELLGDPVCEASDGREEAVAAV
jgi:hypothetical protein